MKNGFKIIGISTRTTNKENKSQSDLEKLWGRFFSENIFEKIPNKVSNEILSIYTDYKSDYTEEYTTILGVPVSTLDEIPNEMIGREFLEEKFEKFTAKGPALRHRRQRRVHRQWGVRTDRHGHAGAARQWR